MNYDLVIRGGTIIDGTGSPRFEGDLAIHDGRIVAVGSVEGTARREIDAQGLIVAPGVIDLHTHYDAQLHWDPYCTASGWHGATTVMLGNCGFGFAPVRPGSAERYMRMMENTEQVPYDAMASTMPWTWETFPEWLDHLRSLPMGVNVSSFLPTNALLSYVVGPDEIKKRAANAVERAEMRRLLHEAMDAGATGFALSYLGAHGNNHVDYDQSPMPTDIMEEEEAYNLADVLRERGEGVIQCLNELPGWPARRDVVEELARRSGRPVLHNIVMAVESNPELHRDVLAWMDRCWKEGLQVWAQGFTFRKPIEIAPLHYNNWDGMVAFRELSSAATPEAKIAVMRSPDFRAAVRAYGIVDWMKVGGGLDAHYLADAGPSERFRPSEGKSVTDIAKAIGEAPSDCFFDIMIDAQLECLFVNPTVGSSPEGIAELLRNPHLLPGTSDGGAHSKHGNGGFWSTDLLIQAGRDSKTLTLEEIHQALSQRPAQAACLIDRGTLTVGNFADMFIYDLAQLNRLPELRYEKVHDLPGGDWRKVKRPAGIRYIAVNGEITFVDNAETGVTPGQFVSNHPIATETRNAVPA